MNPEPKPPPKPEPKPEPVKKPDIAIEKEKKAPPKKEPPKEKPLDLDLKRQLDQQLQRELETVQRERERREALAQFKPAPPSAPGLKADPTYANRIRTKIRGNIILPPNIAGNPEAILDVEQLPTGEVASVKLRRSSGNKSFDEAVERAILKSSPLPLPDRREQFQRRLELKFRPVDE